jgi:hypothetical protein
MGVKFPDAVSRQPSGHEPKTIVVNAVRAGDYVRHVEPHVTNHEVIDDG